MSLVVLAAGWLFLPQIVGSRIERSASDLTGVPFSLGDVSFNPLAGTARLTDVVLESQAPFEEPYVVRVGRIDARFDASTLLSSFIVVHEVVVRDTDIRIEQRGADLNVRDLTRRFSAYLARADTTGPRVFVHEFRVESAAGTVVSSGGSRAFQMRNLTLRDLGSESAGTPVQVVAGNLVEPLLLQALTDAGLNTGVLDRLKGLFGR